MNYDLNQFKYLNENFEKIRLFSRRTVTRNRNLKASYEISLLIAKLEKNLTIRDDLIKPAILTFVNKTVLR